MSEISTVWEGKFVKVDLVDTTTECTIANNVYSLTEMIDLYEELQDAFGIALKKLKKLKYPVDKDD